MTGFYWRNICWGHYVSTDMVNWKPIKEAITPTEDSVVPNGVWSSGAIDMNWQYKGVVYEMENQSALFGTSWELPIILPVSNKAGTVTKYFFCISPAPASSADNKAYYWVGDFDAGTVKFTPDEAFQGEPHLLDYGANEFTGPSCIVDPVSGELYMFSIMQDQRGAAEQGASGWAHTVGLARRIWLKDDGSDLMITPIEALHELRGGSSHQRGQPYPRRCQHRFGRDGRGYVVYQAGGQRQRRPRDRH